MKFYASFPTESEAKNAAINLRKQIGNRNVMILKQKNKNTNIDTFNLYYYEFENYQNELSNKLSGEDKECPTCSQIFPDYKFFNCWNCNFIECINCGSDRLFNGEQSPHILSHDTYIGRCPSCNVAWGVFSTPKEMKINISARDGYGQIISQLDSSYNSLLEFTTNCEIDHLYTLRRSLLSKLYFALLKEKNQHWDSYWNDLIDIYRRIVLYYKENKKMESLKTPLASEPPEITEHKKKRKKIIKEEAKYISLLLRIIDAYSKNKISFEEFDANIKNIKNLISNLPQFNTSHQKILDELIENHYNIISRNKFFISDILDQMIIKQNLQITFVGDKNTALRFMQNYQSSNQMFEALEIANTLQKQYPNDFLIKAMYAMIMKMCCKYKQAISINEWILKNKPDFVTSRHSMCNCLIFLEDYQRVLNEEKILLKDIESIKKIGIDYEVYGNLIISQIGIGKWSKVNKLIRNLENHKDIGEIFVNLQMIKKNMMPEMYLGEIVKSITNSLVKNKDLYVTLLKAQMCIAAAKDMNFSNLLLIGKYFEACRMLVENTEFSYIRAKELIEAYKLLEFREIIKKYLDFKPVLIQALPI